MRLILENTSETWAPERIVSGSYSVIFIPIAIYKIIPHILVLCQKNLEELLRLEFRIISIEMKLFFVWWESQTLSTPLCSATLGLHVENAEASPGVYPNVTSSAEDMFTRACDTSARGMEIWRDINILEKTHVLCLCVGNPFKYTVFSSSSRWHKSNEYLR